MAIYKGDTIVRWAFYGTNETDIFNGLMKLAEIFEPIFIPKVLKLDENNYWAKIQKIDKLKLLKKIVESNYGSSRRLLLMGNPKLKTLDGRNLGQYPEIEKIVEDNIPKYVYGIEMSSSLPLGTTIKQLSKVNLLLGIKSDDWFLSNTDLSGLELFNKCLSEAISRLNPEDFHIDGPAGTDIMKFRNLFNEKGFDIEKVKKFRKKFS